MLPIWQFSDSLPKDRVDQLLGYESYEKILDMLEGMHEIIDFIAEPFNNNRLKGCFRASFLLNVPPDTYDAFFNSPFGYRAQYCKSVEVGEAANREAIERLQPHLGAFADSRVQATFDINRVVKSLQAQDAKIWIYEPEVSSHLGDDDPEILYTPWSQATENGVGLRALRGTKLEVKGGWLDRGGAECRDPLKAGRSQEIHRVGYS